MNCAQFAERWNEHVSGVLEQPDEAAMLEHSHECVSCGRRWRDHRDLAMALDSVTSADRLPDNLTKTVLAGLPVPRLSRLPPVPAVVVEAADGHPAAPAHLPVIAAALAGVVVGFGLVGFDHGYQPEQPFIQLMRMRSLDVSQVVALFMRNASAAIWTGLGIVLLCWITRTTVWETLFPENVPGGVILARRLAVLAVVFGALRILCNVAPLLAWVISVGFTSPPDVVLLAMGETTVALLWSASYWATLTVLAASVLNEVLVRHARPLR